MEISLENNLKPLYIHLVVISVNCGIEMWWLVLCINLTELRVFTQVAGKHFFLDVSLRLFLEEISSWINRLSKADDFHQYRWALSTLLRTWKEQKSEGRTHLFSLLGTSIFCPHPSALLNPRPLNLARIIPWTFLSLQLVIHSLWMTDHRTS